MKDRMRVLAVLDERIQVLQQNGATFKPELDAMIEARATVADLIAVVQSILELPLPPKDLEENALGTLVRAWGIANNEAGHRSMPPDGTRA